MALIGVVADTDTQVSLLDLSEVHYVLGQTLSFVTLEFTAQVEEKAQSLTLCLHGKVLTGSEFQNLFGRFKNRELRRLFSYGSVTERPASGVYDFQVRHQHQQIL